MDQKKQISPPHSKHLTFKALGVTILAFLLSLALEAPFSSSTSSLFSTPEKNDFIISDIYAQIADGRPVRELDSRIAIVDIGLGGREEIAEILEILSLCSPKVVALDINFGEASDDDSRLLSAIGNIPKIVLPLGVAADGDKFVIDEKPFFYDSLTNVTYGVANIPSKSENSSIREYAVDFPTTEGDIPSLVVKIAGIYNPEIIKELKQRGNRLETTAYHSREYEIFTLDNLEDSAEALVDRIILVGALSDASDMHGTPINSYYPGMMIHAHALSTLLDREWYSTLPRAFDYIFAFTTCFLIVLATIGIRNGIRGLIVRLCQIILVYAAVRIGYTLFVDHHIICDFSSTFLMIAFGLFALDIWTGAVALISFLRKKIKSIKQSKREFHMRRLLFILALFSFLSISAHYRIHSVTEGVMLESGGKRSAATKGLVVKPSDNLIIPSGGKVEIYNDLDKRIYTSVCEGKTSVTRLMIDARSAAADNRGNVASRLRFGKKGSDSDKRLYVEKGMVRRSLGVYDPEGEKIVADPAVMASYIASRLTTSGDSISDTMPAKTEKDSLPDGGKMFKVTNTLEFPVYFNIVKIKRHSGNVSVKISEMGQPTGVYVLLPDQTLERGHHHPLASDEIHIMVMAHCQFDIDEMIDELAKALKNDTAATSGAISLPLYLYKI